MKLEESWEEKTIESLEKEYWADPVHVSGLIKTCHRLRKTPIKDFKIEDLRIMIGQNIGLDFLIPLALVELNNNILTEGDFYEGDLLNAVLSCNQDFWSQQPKLNSKLKSIIDKNKELLEQHSPELLSTFLRRFKE